MLLIMRMAPFNFWKKKYMKSLLGKKEGWWKEFISIMIKKSQAWLASSSAQKMPRQSIGLELEAEELEGSVSRGPRRELPQFPKCPCLWVILWYRAVFHSQKEGCFSIQSGPPMKNSSQWEFETSVGIWGMCLCPDSLSYFSHNSMTRKEKKRCPFWQWDILTQPLSNLSFCTFFLPNLPSFFFFNG
jgi:hypothetical protein